MDGDNRSNDRQPLERDSVVRAIPALLIGAIPGWPYSRGWGYAPSGVLGVVVLIIVLLVVMGRI
jgi:hypothetical protein